MGKYKIKNGQMNHGWFREEDLDIIRLRIPSLVEFKGENKLKIDIIYGPADFDVYSRLNLEWAQKWFRKALACSLVGLFIPSTLSCSLLVIGDLKYILKRQDLCGGIEARLSLANKAHSFELSVVLFRG